MQTMVVEGGGTKVCPKCKIAKQIDAEFGYREVRGNILVQSWCIGCRSGKKRLPEGVKPMYIDTNLRPTRNIYVIAYPGDSNWNKRSWRFCVEKLMRKHRDTGCIVLSPEAKAKLGE